MSWPPCESVTRVPTAKINIVNPPINRMCRKSMRYRGANATIQTARMINQCAHHTHQDSVVRTAGSRHGCNVDRMTALAAAARTNAIEEIPKPYSPTRDSIINRPASVYICDLLLGRSLFAGCGLLN